jgi:hypothetical protein
MLEKKQKPNKVSIYSTKSDRKNFQTRRARLTLLQQEATESSKPGETKRDKADCCCNHQVD